MKQTRAMAILISLAFLALSAPTMAAHHEGDAEKAKGHQKVREMKAKGKAHADEMKQEGKTHADEMTEKANDAKGEAMRERRDERKAIMDEAKSTTEPSERKGKKPWWKFWGSDDAE